MEGDQIGHGHDGLNHGQLNWLVLTGASDTMNQDWEGLCRIFWKPFYISVQYVFFIQCDSPKPYSV